MGTQLWPNYWKRTPIAPWLMTGEKKRNVTCDDEVSCDSVLNLNENITSYRYISVRRLRQALVDDNLRSWK